MTQNNTTSFTSAAENGNTILGFFYLGTSLLVMFSNAIVMITVLVSRELWLPTTLNIAFMALCDFCYGLHFLLFAVPSAFLNKFAYPQSFIVPCACFSTLLYGQNVLNIVVATVDRYLSICWPLRYPTLMTAKRFFIAIIITVCINVCRLCLVVSSGVYYNVDLGVTGSKFNTLSSVVASVGLPAVSVIVIVSFLLKIAREMLRSRRLIYPATRYHTGHRFTVTMSLSAGLFCLCYVPTSSGIIWNLVAGKDSVPLTMIRFAVLCLMSNSLWNVFIYATTYRPFRNAFLRVFCKDYYRRKCQMEVRVIFRNESNQR